MPERRSRGETLPPEAKLHELEFGGSGDLGIGRLAQNHPDLDAEGLDESGVVRRVVLRRGCRVGSPKEIGVAHVPPKSTASVNGTQYVLSGSSVGDGLPGAGTVPRVALPAATEADRWPCVARPEGDGVASHAL